MTIFERQTTGGTFVAYEAKPSRNPVEIAVGESTEQTSVHPEVFIREYPVIKVQSLSPTSNGGLSVAFDPASVPVGEGVKKLEKAITVNTEAGGDIEKALRWALDHDAELYMGMEMRRKYKNKSGEVIPYDATIMALRGFTDDGKATDGAMGASGSNISKVLAVVGLVAKPESTLVSGEVRSNPYTWAALRSNRVGATPPPEWVRITRPDGTPGGAAISRDTWRELTGAHTGGGTVLDDEALGRIAEAVAVRMGADSGEPTMTRPPQRGARSVEGKPFQLFNSDGRVNPGSYAMGGLLRMRNTAQSILGVANYLESEAAQGEGRDPQLLTQDEINGTATKLMGALAAAADTVQSAVTGKPANRIDASHKTAANAIDQIAQNDVPLTVGIIRDGAAKGAWLQEVTTAATDLVVAMVGLTEQFADAHAEPAPTNDMSGRAQRESARQNPPTDQTRQVAPETSKQAANTSVSSPSTPDFTTEETADSAPAGAGRAVESIAARNEAALAPLLQNPDVNVPLAAVAPFLATTFGTADLNQIDPDTLADRIQVWSTDLYRFKNAAGDAFRAANQIAS